MDNGMSIADAMALRGDNGGFGMGNDSLIWLVVLFLFFGQNGFNQHGFGGAATAATQQEILLGQQFDRVEGKLDGIGKGICDSTYAITGAVTGEGRAIQTQLAECCCNTQLLGKDIMTAMNAGFQRVVDNQNGIEMQHLRDAQMRDYIDKSLCGVVRYPMGMTYATNCNPFCPQPNPCGCGNGF